MLPRSTRLLIVLCTCLGIAGASHPHPTAPRHPRGTAPGGLRLQPQPSREIPILRAVRWEEVGPTGDVLEVRAESVHRRPRRVGLLTFQSFHEIVARNVRLTFRGDPPQASSARESQSQPTAFRQLQESINLLHALVREGLQTTSPSEQVLTRTFLSGAVFEGFALAVAGGGGRLESRTLTMGAGEPGGVLAEVRVETADGERLTVQEARWTGDGRLVARGPFTLVGQHGSQRGRQGCFLVQVDGGIRIDTLGEGTGNRPACAAQPSAVAGGLPPDLNAPSASPQATVSLTQVLPFLPLPAVPIPAQARGRYQYLKMWLLPSLARPGAAYPSPFGPVGLPEGWTLGSE